ncbi:thymidine kinase [Virgibacillus halodenitrificans]|uniref:thymidine kinase n=1 Tax=Virgibacillus halodenitrificans TaxID=1482 RepID=UPI000EF50EB3|nr:AAA family ATPase [Virgibacillus halodenitrificans]
MKTSLIVGSMFSGKSTLLNKQIREVRRLDCFHVMVFKPFIDDRYDSKTITTHDQVKEKTNLLIKHPLDIWNFYQEAKPNINKNKKTICFIDECQFISPVDTLVKVIRDLNKNKVDVVAAGLDMDKFGNPFGATPSLMAIADEVNKLKTKCGNCGEDSYTQVSLSENKEIIDIGGSESYMPVCKNCYFEFMEKIERVAN